MRGEHCTAYPTQTLEKGSSPHARGARRHVDAVVDAEGIIPACAGSTRLAGDVAGEVGDHPRMRGEHASPTSRRQRTRGSSPHARGARRSGAGYEGMGGIIPACAGSTPPWRRCRRPRGDHPRMRGEHLEPLSVASSLAGSSPHARGAHLPVNRAGVLVGIIPACAGSTMTRFPTRRSGRDHPRMRGEHATISLCGGQAEGSSPHARGAHRRPERRDSEDGIIPACAGSTSSRYPMSSCL